MRIEWTPQALYAWQRIGEYILFSFGVVALSDYETETYEVEQSILGEPFAGQLELYARNQEMGYRYRLINRKTKLIYHIETDKIIIDQCWDTRMNPETLVQKL